MLLTQHSIITEISCITHQYSAIFLHGVKFPSKMTTIGPKVIPALVNETKIPRIDTSLNKVKMERSYFIR